MPNSEKPLGQAIVICDRIIVDAETNNKTLVSTFNSITAPHFPARHPFMAVYTALTNGAGKKLVELIMRDTSNNNKIFAIRQEFGFANPNMVAELIFNLRNVIFFKPGLYAFEVWVDGEPLLENRFNVHLMT